MTHQNEMNRPFDTFSDQPQTERERGEGGWLPALDLLETADHYLLRADLPGVSEDDVTVRLEDSVLTIAGHRAAAREQQGYYRRERVFGPFSRSLTLPAGVDAERIRARFDHGVLEVRIPKPDHKEPQQVPIQLSRCDENPGTIDETETAEVAGAEAQTADREPEPALA